MVMANEVAISKVQAGLAKEATQKAVRAYKAGRRAKAANLFDIAAEIWEYAEIAARREGNQAAASKYFGKVLSCNRRSDNLSNGRFGRV